MMVPKLFQRLSPISLVSESLSQDLLEPEQRLQEGEEGGSHLRAMLQLGTKNLINKD